MTQSRPVQWVPLSPFVTHIPEDPGVTSRAAADRPAESSVLARALTAFTSALDIGLPVPVRLPVGLAEVESVLAAGV